MPFTIDITSLLVGVALGIVLGGLCIIALIRAADFLEGPLGAAEYATRYPIRYGEAGHMHACAAALTSAETNALHAGRNDIAVRIHDIRGELADWNAA